MKLILYLAIGGMIGTLARYALGGLLQPSRARQTCNAVRLTARVTETQHGLLRFGRLPRKEKPRAPLDARLAAQGPGGNY